MVAVFELTGDADAYSKKLVSLALIVGTRLLMRKSIAECYTQARPGFPEDWHRFLDAMFGFKAEAT
jgi:hypothetical protein